MDKKLEFVMRYNYLFYTMIGEIRDELDLFHMVMREFITDEKKYKDRKNWVFSSLLDMNYYERDKILSEDKEYMDEINGVYNYFETIIGPRKLLVLSNDRGNKDLVESIKYLMNMMSKESSSEGVVNIRDSLIRNLGGNK